MVNVTMTDTAILAVGHAETKEICGLFSGLVVAVTIGLDKLGESEAYELSSGFFHIDLNRIRSDPGSFLCEVFTDGLCQLCEDFPGSFSFTSI